MIFISFALHKIEHICVHMSERVSYVDSFVFFDAQNQYIFSPIQRDLVSGAHSW